MVKKSGNGKIAAYVAKYSNASSGAGYKGAIENFLRCIYGLKKEDKKNHDYENLLEQYLNDKRRNHSNDVKHFVDYLKENSKSMPSVRQVLTYAVKFLKAQGIVISQEFVQDIKRETKGGAATVAKPLTNDMICRTIQGASVRDRAIILTLASSGLRIGELLSLDIDDIELENSPVKIVIRAAKAKNKHSRFTYCSQEAKEAILSWLKNRDTFLAGSAKHNLNLLPFVGKTAKKEGSDKIITTGAVNVESTLLFPVSDGQINAAWETCLRKAGLFLKDTDSNRNIYRLHSLRKFFDTKLSSTAMPEKLVQFFEGHLSELANKYYVPSEEFAGAEYLKYQDVLTVCVPERIKETIKTLAIETAELKKQDATQYESIEYLRNVNKAQQTAMSEMMTQMKEIVKKVDDLQKEVNDREMFFHMPDTLAKNADKTRKPGIEVEIIE